MKAIPRVVLLAVLIVIGIASSQVVQAAPVTPANLDQVTAVVPPLSPNGAPNLSPNAQGCSGTPNVQYAYANPSTISAGQVTTLQWGLVGNASAAFLVYPNGNTVGIGTPGSQQVNPTTTRTYFIRAVCGSNTVNVPITVNVNNSPTCSGTPQITSFTANPTTVNNGQSATISWGQVNNSDNVQFSSSTQGGSGVPTPGSVSVQPNQTTTYFLTAWCQGNSVQSQVVVTVNNAPPPPPPPSANAITSITNNGGLTSSTALIVSVQYFWNGEDAPANLQGTAFGSGGQQLGMSNATNIVSGPGTTANLNFPIAPSQITRVNVCMTGSSGTQLVCQNQNR